MRPNLPLAFVTAVALLPRPSLAQIDPHREMEIVERALDAAVRKVSRAGPAQAPGMAEFCRSYRLEGYGVVFVVPPRLLPRRSVARLLTPQDENLVSAIATLEAALARVPPSPIRQEMQQRLAALRQAQIHPPLPLAGAPLARDPQRVREIHRLEQEAQQLARQAAASREDAEKAMADVREQVRMRLEVVEEPAEPTAALVQPGQPPQPDVPPAPSTPPQPPSGTLVLSGTATPLPPPPPWAFWFESEEPDPRPAAAILSDVKTAVVDTLESVGPRLTSMPMDDHLVVAVDFFPEGAFGPWARPEKTLVVRVRQKELIERAHGQIAADELRRRMETREY
jgi:hypothetical protein